MFILVVGDGMAKSYSVINFGLISIPVEYSSAVINNDISFHQLHKKCLERIKYQKYCPHCHKVLKESEIVKGIVHEDEELVVFEKKELDALKPENDGDIEIVSFVPLKEIDPKYMQKNYFLIPAKKGKAYYLLLETLNKMKLVGLCKMIFHNKFYYAILRSTEDSFLLTTLFFEEEMQEVPSLKIPKLTSKELELATLLVKKMQGHFEPENYHDEYQETVLKAIDLKAKGKGIRKSKKKTTKELSSLMQALEKSLKA